MLSSRVLAVVCATLVPLTAWAQQRAITLDDLYDPQKRIDLGGFSAGVTWLDDSSYLQMRGGRGQEQGWLKVDALTGTTTPFFDTATARDRSCRPGRRVGRGCETTCAAIERHGRSRPPEHADDRERRRPVGVQPVAHGDDAAHRRRPLSLHVRQRGHRQAHQRQRRRRGPAIQPRWPVRGLHARRQPVHRRRRHATRTAAHHRRERRDPERAARLGVPGGDLRARHVPRVLVEPRLDAAGLPAPRRASGAGVHARRPHPAPPATRGVRLPEGGRSQSHRDARDRAGRRRAGPVRRHLEVLGQRTPHRQRVVESRGHRRRVFAAGSRADLARPERRQCRHGSDQDPLPRNDEGLGRQPG